LTGFRLAEPVWAPNLVTLPPGVGDDDGAAAAGVEAEGGVRNGVGDGNGMASREVASREVAAAPREAAPRLGSLTVQNQISPRLGFHVSRGTSLIPGTLLVSVDIIQPMPKISFMVSTDVIQPILIIFCLYRLVYVSRYQQSSAYKYRPHTTVLTEHTVAAATVLTERTVPTKIIPLFLRYFFNFL
jgi:hypothetical protein